MRAIHNSSTLSPLANGEETVTSAANTGIHTKDQRRLPYRFHIFQENHKNTPRARLSRIYTPNQVSWDTNQARPWRKYKSGPFCSNRSRYGTRPFIIPFPTVMKQF